jgi:excinuclease UvrABC helicase subunit UvrB
VVKEIQALKGRIYDMDYFTVPVLEEEMEFEYKDKDDLIKKLEAEMVREAKELNFEKAAILRDKIEEIRQLGPKAMKKKKYNFKL